MMRLKHFIPLAAGIICALFAVYTLVKTFAFLQTAARTTATVIEFKEGDDTFAPVFRFFTKNNEEIRYTYPVYTSPKSWSVGEEATVAYDPQQPAEVRLLTFWGTFNITTILFAAAAALMVRPVCRMVLRRFLQ